MQATTFPSFDGSGRPPRNLQLVALDKIAEALKTHDVVCAQLPTGIGKSAIAKAIQIEMDANIISSANSLLTQYGGDYSTTNILKGRDHYACHVGAGVSCGEMVDVIKGKACNECPYVRSRNRATSGSHTVYNPISLWRLKMGGLYVTKPVTVVDEAHSVASLLTAVTGTRMRAGEYRYPKNCVDERVITKWMAGFLGRLRKLIRMHADKDNKTADDFHDLRSLTRKHETLELVLAGLRDDPSQYAIWEDEQLYRGKPSRYLNVKPLSPPRRLVDTVLGTGKIVLLSATLFPHDIHALIGSRPYAFIDLPSPIPRQNRPVVWRPTPFPMNSQTDPVLIAAAIDKILSEYPGTPTMVHVSYDLAGKLLPHIKHEVFTNTRDDKEAQIAAFKARGGVFVAAGCAEGLDLKNDFCRLQCIPKLLYPNRGDECVVRKLARQGGNEWYQCETLKATIQQVGRSTRNETDWSRTYILDPNFQSLVRRIKHLLPASFLESLVGVSL